MTDKRISQLTNITGSNVDDANDELAIVDASSNETKAITRAELFSSVSSMSLSGGTIDGTTVGGTTAASGTFTDLTVDEATLSAIAETKADTAVDVFVYDTSKDSDGGAWRHRTQHTSWYNETLNTATRGARREFPAVAVIVAESDKVTIYDGDDPSLPMWKVSKRQSALGGLKFAELLWGPDPQRQAQAVVAQNGQIAVAVRATGTSNNGQGLLVFNYASDTVKKYQIVSISSGLWQGNVADTSDPNGIGIIPETLPAIINQNVNDVAMTVLPDAPTDPATGIQRVTIACATDGGVSVIKDDGTVVDSEVPQECDNARFVDEGLWFTDTLGSDLNFATYADISAGDGFGDRIAQTNWGGSDFDLLSEFGEFTVAGDLIAGGDDRVIEDSVLGLMLHQPNYTDQSKGMSALLTSTYNTGWMNGDIKLAALSDTNDTDLVGSGELVTNGTFDTDTDWTKDPLSSGVSWSISGGSASVDTTGTSASDIFQFISGLEAGRSYVMTVDVVSLSGSLRLFARDASWSETGDIAVTSATTYSITLVASSTTAPVSFRAGGDTVVTIDNISVKLADADRSVNNNGLIVNGTVSRDPVSSGADLVAYSGFSSSDYLSQPYNPDLDFGTGDFCVMGWVKTDVASSDYAISWESSNNSSGNPRWGVKVASGTNEIAFNINGGIVASTGVAASGGWDHICFIRASGVLSGFINGAKKVSVANTTDLTGTDGRLKVGDWVASGGLAFSGSLALLRISATAPTAEQIKKIYEDEKFLFQENAQASLAGTSDAVTALAYDEVTDLLHVGTSDGRSVFQGLRRVDNTTDAVSTAISASNNLIVED